jgi:hypothetical protein
LAYAQGIINPETGHRHNEVVMNRHHVFLLSLLTVISVASLLLPGQPLAEGNPRFTLHQPELFREAGALTNEGSAVDVEVTVMTAPGRKSVRLVHVAPADYAGRYLILKIDRQGGIAP